LEKVNLKNEFKAIQIEKQPNISQHTLSVLTANTFFSTVMQYTYIIYVPFLFVVRNDDGFKVGSMAHGFPSGLHSVDDGQHQLWSQSRVFAPQHTS